VNPIRAATCPDSWGVWNPVDPLQTPPERFLDEASAAGYSAIELGPLGYLAATPEDLLPELRHRELELTGVMLMGRFHAAQAVDDLADSLDQLLAIATAADARYLILLPRGEPPDQRTIDGEGWRLLAESAHTLADRAAVRGLRTVLHPHADTPVESEAEIERFLELTDRHRVNLCLDTGHHAYAGGEPVAFVREHRARIEYLHLKNVDSAVLARARSEGWDFGEAVRNEVFCLLEEGSVDMRALKQVLDETAYAGWAVVEQDMYPAPFDKPLPIARRNLAYLRELGFDV